MFPAVKVWLLTECLKEGMEGRERERWWIKLELLNVDGILIIKIILKWYWNKSEF
jgi:hypothetical protein